MSGPLRHLNDQAGRRVPLPGSRKVGGGSRPVPFRHKQPSPEELTAEYLAKPRSTRGAGRHAVPRMGSGGSRKRGGALDLDLDLMSTMTARLGKVEAMLRTADAELAEKEGTIKQQRERLRAYELADKSFVASDQAVAELSKKNRKLLLQVAQMEAFLADYGMIWIGGDDDDDDDDNVGEGDAALDAAAEALRGPGDPRPASVVGGGRLWTPAAAVPEAVEPDFDKIIRHVEELNTLAGEGQGHVVTDRNGAKRIETQEAVPLRLYKNGIMLFDGPFRSYDEPETKQCIADLTDGFFPAELQRRYPDGVPFQLFDLRAEQYEKGSLGPAAFQGVGMTLGGEIGQSRLVVAGKDGSAPAASNIRSVGQLHGAAVPTVPTAAFLNRLPKQVIKGGKIIDIRAGIADAVQGGGGAPKVIVVETPVVSEMRDRLEATAAAGSGQPPSSAPAGDVATIQVKTKDNQKLILKLRFGDTIQMLRKCIDTHLGTSAGYKLQTAYPRKVLDDDSKTLVDAGLTPSATVHMR